MVAYGDGMKVLRNKPNWLFGIGINDADYEITVYDSSGDKPRLLWMCPFYRVWANMLKRCYSANYQKNSKTYQGCTVVPEWHVFSSFRAWMYGQDWIGLELDKDILLPGNKVYGPDTCVFISGRLNKFTTDSRSARGAWPVGICWNARDGRFQAQCQNPFTGRRESLGYFTDHIAAHEAWRRRKHELSCLYADQQTDLRIAKALRTRYIGPIAA